MSRAAYGQKRGKVPYHFVLVAVEDGVAELLCQRADGGGREARGLQTLQRLQARLRHVLQHRHSQTGQKGRGGDVHCNASVLKGLAFSKRVGSYLEDEVEPVVVLKVVQQRDDVGVLQLAQELELAHLIEVHA